MSVDQDGALQNTVQAVNYGPGSGVHGLAVSPNNAVLYSADDSGNAVWTHLIHPEQGNLAPVDSIPGPQSGSGPRHITVQSQRTTYIRLARGNQQTSRIQDKPCHWHVGAHECILPVGSWRYVQSIAIIHTWNTC